MTENQKEVEKIKTKIVFFVKLKNSQTCEVDSTRKQDSKYQN